MTKGTTLGHKTTLGLLLAAGFGLVPLTQADWKAYNDHAPGTVGTQTSPNATTLNTFISGISTNLHNITDGSALSATLTVTTNGPAGCITGGNTTGVPNSGTPLATEFDGYVYFGNGSTPSAALQIKTTGTHTLTFSNLDPSKRYRFKGGTVRGNNYLDRWTLVNIEGADNVVPNHQQGASSPYGYLDATRVPGTLSGYQVAMDFGENRAGDMVEYDEIDPGADGTFAITSTQYSGPVPAGFGVNTTDGASGGTYGYAISGFSLEESTPGGSALTVSVSPAADQSVQQCSTVSWRASAGGGTPPYTYQWYMNDTGTPVEGATTATLTLSNVQSTAEGSYFVIVQDATPGGAQMAPSDPHNLAVTANDTVPTLLSAVGSGFYTVTVSFSKPVAISSATGANFLIQAVHDASTVAISSAVVENGTNVVLTTSQSREGKNYQVVLQGNGVTDTCNGSSVSGTVAILDRLSLLAFTGSWRYNQDGVDYGTDWKEFSYPNETSWPEGPGAFDGKSGTTRATIGGVSVGTQLQLVNASSPFGTATLPSYYFRTHITMPANVDPSGAVVQMRTLLDDAAIVYVNGREVWRSTSVTATNEPFSSYLNGTVGDAAVSASITLNATNFADGDNVVAVYLKQGNNGSSDITMGLELTAVITNYYITGGPLQVSAAPASVSIAQCQGFTLTGSASGGTRPYSYQWFKGSTALTDGANISGANGMTLVVNNAQPAESGSYHLTVTDAASASASSANVPVTVAADSAPAIVSALGSTDLHTVTVTFDKPIQIASATGANFQVQATEGGGTLTITTSYVTNANEVILLTADARQQRNYNVVVQGAGVTGTCSGLPVAAGTSLRLVSQVLIFGLDSNNSWQYNQAGVDLGTAWLANAYNDQDSAAGWATGLALFDGKEPARTTVNGQTVQTQLALTNTAFPTTAAVIPTYYFRKHFELPVAAQNMSLGCRTFFDDWGILYVNGQEAYRNTNIVATNEAFALYTRLGTAVGDANFSSYVPLPMTNCTSAGNVLAVYLKQTSPGSSDVTMGLELIATVTNWPAVVTGPRLTIVNNGNGTATISWTPASGTLQEATDLGTWADSSNQNNGAARAISGRKFYRVR